MSITPQTTESPTGYPVPAPSAPGRNGLSTAGFILAILIAPVGFVLSLVGLIQASRRQQKGKVLASLGLVISVLLMGITGVVMATVGRNVATVADPGCATGKSAILSMSNPSSDPATLKTQLQTVIDGLNSAAAQAKHDNVRAALKSLSADYGELVKDVDTGVQPANDLQTRIDNDANAIDALCTIGGAK